MGCIASRAQGRGNKGVTINKDFLLGNRERRKKGHYSVLSTCISSSHVKINFTPPISLTSGPPCPSGYFYLCPTLYTNLSKGMAISGCSAATGLQEAGQRVELSSALAA